MKNSNLHSAKKAKNDEFYTQYKDIEKEMEAYFECNKDAFRGKTVLLPCDDPEWSNFTLYFAQNFKRLGLNKVISTSYAQNSKHLKAGYQPTLFESDASQYDKEKSVSKGKIFIVDKDITGDGKIDIDDLQWKYLDGDGDFRSEEVTRLLDAADIVVTNPPFSLFREFLAWVVEADKQFLMVGHQNAITYKEVFPLIRDNEMWLGQGFTGGAGHFINKHYEDYATASNHKDGMIRVSGVHWFTNIEHNKRHEPLEMMTMADNLKHSKKKINGYPKYDNYDAIEVSFTKAIPSDYKGVMGVPITFLDKYCPEQFEIIGMAEDNGRGYSGGIWDGKNSHCVINGENKFKRIFIKHKNPSSTPTE